MLSNARQKRSLACRRITSSCNRGSRPYLAAEDGVAGRLKDLNTTRDQLADEIAAIEQTPQGPLADRVQTLADHKKSLDERLAQLNAQFNKLGSLRKDVEGLFANFDRALDMLSDKAKEDDEADIDARVAELATFIETTQAHLGEIERRAVAFTQLRSKLGEVQSRLAPLEADESGVVHRDWGIASSFATVCS